MINTREIQILHKKVTNFVRSISTVVVTVAQLKRTCAVMISALKFSNRTDSWTYNARLYKYKYTCETRIST